MLNVKKLQAIRDKILGVTVNTAKYGDLNSVVYLQQILDAVQSIPSTPSRVRGNLNEKIYLQKIRNAKLGVADGQFGSLSNSIYLQQIINAFNGVTSTKYGSLSENSYLDVWYSVASGGDTTAPTCTITCAQTSPSAVSPLNMTFTLSAVSTDFAVGDITVGNGTVGNFAGSGASYTADVTPSGLGPVTVDVAAGAFHDAAGNANTAATQFVIYSTYGLISWWKLDEVSDGSVATSRNDSFGTNHLTDFNTTASATGLIGNAADLERDNAEYLYRADNASLRTGDIDFTIAGWVRFESAPPNNQGQTLWGKYKITGNQEEYVVVWERIDGSSENHLIFDVSNDGSAYQALKATTLGTPQINTWYFVVAWHDSVNNTMNIQVNNGNVDSVAHTTGAFAGNGNFQIGAIEANVYSLDGKADEVFYAKRVLSAANRTWLYNGGAGRSLSEITGNP